MGKWLKQAFIGPPSTLSWPQFILMFFIPIAIFVDLIRMAGHPLGARAVQRIYKIKRNQSSHWLNDAEPRSDSVGPTSDAFLAHVPVTGQTAYSACVPVAQQLFADVRTGVFNMSSNQIMNMLLAVKIRKQISEIFPDFRMRENIESILDNYSLEFNVTFQNELETILKNASRITVSYPDVKQEIENLAYTKWVQSGKRMDDDLCFWLKAEKELYGEGISVYDVYVRQPDGSIERQKLEKD